MKNNYQIKIEKHQFKNSKRTYFRCYDEGELLGEIMFQYIDNASIYFSSVLDYENCIQNFPKNKVTYIEILDVIEKHQNKGIGKYLMENFIIFCKKNKEYSNIILSAVPFGNEKLNLKSLEKFYQKFDFRTIAFELIERELHPIMVNTK